MGYDHINFPIDMDSRTMATSGQAVTISCNSVSVTQTSMNGMTTVYVHGLSLDEYEAIDGEEKEHGTSAWKVVNMIPDLLTINVFSPMGAKKEVAA